MTEHYKQRKVSNERYLKKLEDVKFRVPLGEKAIIQATAQAAGLSVNQFILDAVHEKIEREKRK
ncbi:MAG: hypothetical protein LUE11_05150 [Clostridia bacterium]|nr:hypothetical protein [Clostridia bacterium]